MAGIYGEFQDWTVTREAAGDKNSDGVWLTLKRNNLRVLGHFMRHAMSEGWPTGGDISG